MVTKVRIDLTEARTAPESRVYSGRDRGETARRKFGLAGLDASDDVVTVVIPPGTYPMNMSFFLGMFGDSIRKLGKEGFTQKYQFECKDVHRASIQDGIDRALKESSIWGNLKLPYVAMV